MLEVKVCARFSFVSIFLFLALTVGQGQMPVTTWHYDNARTGANTNETTLTPQNVNGAHFGKLFTQPVDGAITGQALYLPGISIPGAGVHNIVYVATMHDSVYAFDADSASKKNAAPLWHTNFLKQGVTTVPIAKQGCGATTKWTEVGIVSTPVIDPAAGTLYVVAKTFEKAKSVHRLHALDVATGEEKRGSPVVISGSYELNGNKDVFQDAMQVNRPALLLENGNIYIAFGSNGCRGDLEAGWVMAYDASSLAAEGAFDVEPGSSAAAIWQRGGGLSSDSSGYIYGATGDGDFAAGKNFGQSIFKLSQVRNALDLSDWFTPYNERDLERHDLDLSEPVLVLPNQTGNHPHLIATLGKEGTIYILNRDKMGHFCSTCTLGDTQIVGELPAVAPEPGALVYWNNTIYTSAAGSPILALPLKNGNLLSKPTAQSKKTTNGHSPVISANNNDDGLLWQINGSSLTAYDAITLQRLYSAGQNGDGLPALPHFANVMVANGKVYIGTYDSLAVYGLF